MRTWVSIWFFQRINFNMNVSSLAAPFFIVAVDCNSRGCNNFGIPRAFPFVTHVLELRLEEHRFGLLRVFCKTNGHRAQGIGDGDLHICHLHSLEGKGRV
jgi:hypothetical protein